MASSSSSALSRSNAIKISWAICALRSGAVIVAAFQAPRAAGTSPA
jgi:hypothetical protein